jgi:Protein of unknown function (DUF5818)
MLRRMTVPFLVLILAGVPLYAADWTGWLVDEHCGAKGASPGHKSCALKCAKDGAALMLYTPADEKLYKLSDQDAAKKHVGEKVKVVGTLDGETITVESINADKAE